MDRLDHGQGSRRVSGPAASFVASRVAGFARLGAPRPRAGAITSAAAALRGLADAWLARACLLCERRLALREDGLCSHCETELPGATWPRCPRCAARAHTGTNECERCAREAPSFDLTVTLADYAPPLDSALLALKFGGEIALAAPLGRMLARASIRAWGGSGAPVPGADPGQPGAGTIVLAAVPLAAARLAERGFNQSERIARPAARALGARFEPGLLVRTRDTPAQSRLALAGRKDNLAAAFAATRELHDTTVVVVDDVMTSGATLNACALALKTAGARAVLNLVAARTP